MERTERLFKMVIDGLAKGIELVLNSIVNIMTELCVLSVNTVEETLYMQARVSDPATRRFCKSGHGFFKNVQLCRQVVTEHGLLKDVERLLHTVSEIFMNVFIAFANMRQEVLSTLTHIPHAMAPCLCEAGQIALKGVEFRR